MIIYWRVCEDERTLSHVPRWQGASKKEILRKSWLSLQAAIRPEKDLIYIIEDKCSEETINWLKSTAIGTVSVKHVEDGSTTEENRFVNPIHYIKLVEWMDEYTQKEPNEVHFLCNDDFLFLPHALELCESIFNEGWNGFVVPYDYVDRYTIDRTRQCELFLSSLSHWRTVPSCTGVTMAKGIIWQHYMSHLKRQAKMNDDSWTWIAYGQVGGISPIPGVATHLTENHMTPRVDWKGVWDSLGDIDGPNSEKA